MYQSSTETIKKYQFDKKEMILHKLITQKVIAFKANYKIK